MTEEKISKLRQQLNNYIGAIASLTIENELLHEKILRMRNMKNCFHCKTTLCGQSCNFLGTENNSCPCDNWEEK